MSDDNSQKSSPSNSKEERGYQPFNEGYQPSKKGYTPTSEAPSSGLPRPPKGGSSENPGKASHSSDEK